MSEHQNIGDNLTTCNKTLKHYFADRNVSKLPDRNTRGYVVRFQITRIDGN